MNKCLKLAVYANDTVLDKDKVYKELHNISHLTKIACNKAMNEQYRELLRKLDPNAIKDKELYGKTFGSWLENQMNVWMEGVLSNNVASTRQFVTNKSNFNPTNILKGEETISTFMRDMPVFVHNGSYKIKQVSKNLYDIEVGLFNIPKQKELGCKRINFSFIKVENYAKAILDRLINGEYKQGTAQLVYNNRKKKWMIIISYSFENKVNNQLEEDKVMGVDLGITNIATFSVFDKSTQKYERISWKQCILDGKELIHFRQKVEARRRQLSIASKWCSDNKIGHGYKQRMRDVNKYEDKIARFKDTYNHKISRYIVDMALKYHCKTIQMEDLSGFSEQQSESLLKNWAYYDLQNKIKYKAEEVGIEVIFINPKYTSKRCNVCGCIHKDNRDCKNNQSKFKCVVCGHEDNADINASKNIAIPYIDTIIKEYLKENEID